MPWTESLAESTRLVIATVSKPAHWTPIGNPSRPFHESPTAPVPTSKNGRFSSVGRSRIIASTRDHFPGMIEPPRHGAFQLPPYLHGPFRLMISIMGTAKAVVGKGFASAIPFAFTHEQDDVRASVWLLDVAASRGRIRDAVFCDSQ